MKLHWIVTVLAFVIGIGILAFSLVATQNPDPIDRMLYSRLWVISLPFLLGAVFGVVIAPIIRRSERRRKLMNEMIDDYERWKEER